MSLIPHNCFYHDFKTSAVQILKMVIQLHTNKVQNIRAKILVKIRLRRAVGVMDVIIPTIITNMNINYVTTILMLIQ